MEEKGFSFNTISINFIYKEYTYAQYTILSVNLLIDIIGVWTFW